MYGVRYHPDNVENIQVMRKGERQVVCSVLGEKRWAAEKRPLASREQLSHQPHITRDCGSKQGQIPSFLLATFHIPITI